MAAYISEIGFPDDGDGFIEVAVPAGTDTSGYVIAIYDEDGELQTTVPLGSVEGTMFGSDVYVIDGASIGLDEDDAFALIDGDGNVVQFVSFEDDLTTATDGPAAGSTSTNIGSLDEDETLGTTDGGATYVAQPSPTPGPFRVMHPAR